MYCFGPGWVGTSDSAVLEVDHLAKLQAMHQVEHQADLQEAYHLQEVCQWLQMQLIRQRLVQGFPTFLITSTTASTHQMQTQV